MSKMRSKLTFKLFTLLVYLIYLNAVDTFFVYTDAGDIEKIFTKLNSSVTLPCIPHFKERNINNLQWYKEDRKIVDIENEQIIFFEKDHRMSYTPETSSLQIKNVQYRDTGEYRCMINNQFKRSGQMKLIVQGPPDPPPGRPLFLGLTSRSVNLSWTPSKDNHHSPIIHYIIQVRINENEEYDTSRTLVTPDNRTSFHVTNLQPFTIYSFRVIAKNAIGLSAPSDPSFNTYTLRELPEGSPQIVQASNMNSSNSIKIAWIPPPNNTLNGELVGYKIIYKPRDHPEKETEITLENANVQEYTIKNLETYTQYVISLQVFNLEGKGPAKLVTAMTDEGVPSPPVNVTKIRVGQKDIKLKWFKPESLNGNLRGYYIYVHDENENKTETHQILKTSPSVDFEINNLKSNSPYKIWIKAFNLKHTGNDSEIIHIQTDIEAPLPPFIMNLTCNSSNIVVQWEQPRGNYERIDLFYIFYKQEEEDKFHQIVLNNNKNYSIYIINNNVIHEYCIRNLTQFKLYEVKIRSEVKSIIEDIPYLSDFSESRKVFLHENCRSYSVASSSESLGLASGITIGILCMSLLVILVFLSLFIWKKYFQAAYYYLDDPPNSTITRGSSPRMTDTYDDEFLGDNDYSGDNKSVLVSLWAKHVQNLHADGDIGFSREYEAIQASTNDAHLPSEHSQLPENKSKNRYLNIVAYDHSRVILKSQGLQKKSSDYINANYIDGYCKPKAYIGTQGPLPSTFNDFWRMVWEQRVCIIVMITNLVERGRRKCDMYWPREGTETYGNIEVKLLQEVVMATYTLRTFNIKNLKLKKQKNAGRQVYQYQFTSWKDHSVPDYPLPVLSFIRKSVAANPAGSPMIIHCSAGIGRTGAYVVIDAMLKQIKHRNTVNVYGFLKHIRQQRNYLIQTEEQYIFVHDALLEAIESGETEVPSSHLSKYIQTLQTGGDNISCNSDLKNSYNVGFWPLLEKQYKLVTNFRPKDFNVVSALKQINKGKNRSLNLIPLEQHRVHITPKVPGQEAYINATFLPGFNSLDEFIITQHPLSDTIDSFWQMVWDKNSQTIVMLSNVIEEKNFPQYWPEKNEIQDFGSFKLKLIEETRLVQESGNMITTRDLILQSNQDDFELAVRIIHSPGWPNQIGPLNNVFDLIKVVQNWNLEYQNGPIIVMDKYGGTESATFCCLTTLYKQLNFEDCVDVYMYAKLYHLRRPGIWSQDDYLFLYRAVEQAVSQMNLGDPISNSPFGSELNMNGHVNNTNGHIIRSDKHSIKSDSIV